MSVTVMADKGTDEMALSVVDIFQVAHASYVRNAHPALFRVCTGVAPALAPVCSNPQNRLEIDLKQNQISVDFLLNMKCLVIGEFIEKFIEKIKTIVYM